MENRSDISKNFIPYELALKMKKLGFNEDCFGVYVNGNFEPRYRSRNSKFNPNGKLDKRNLEYCTAPLYQQVSDWFRQKFNLVSWVFQSSSELFHYSILRNGRFLTTGYENTVTYEESRLKCLEKIIEIVENDNKKHI